MITLSVTDYVKTFVPPPNWLEQSWDSAKRQGLDKLTPPCMTHPQNQVQTRTMIRVIIDTNILVSTRIQPESLLAAVLMLALSGLVQMCVSDAVFAEHDEVIRRPRLKQLLATVEGTLFLTPNKRFRTTPFGV